MDRDIVLGPLFTVGTLLVVVGGLRRSRRLALLGASAIVADRVVPLPDKLNVTIVPD